MGKPARTRNSRYGRWKSSATRTIDRKPIRPLERQRMRPWLLELLDANSCSQLIWLNKREKKFRVAWKHAAGQNWEIAQDACLFELWARHTGKYYDGDKPNPKKWKANFRCALNSLPDVEQDKALGIKRGLNAFKVYKFLDEKKQRPKKSPGTKCEESDDDDECDDYDDGSSDNGAEWTPVPRALRPSRVSRVELDSEGSEAGSSPSHSGSESDDTERILAKPTSPLPHFEQIIPQHLQEAMRGSFVENRFPETHSPQASSSEDDDSASNDGSTDDTQFVELMFQEGCDLDNLMSNSYPPAGPDDLSMIFEDQQIEEGPSVIVESEDCYMQDWNYTSIEDL